MSALLKKSLISQLLKGSDVDKASKNHYCSEMKS